jgi:hypothetical protein
MLGKCAKVVLMWTAFFSVLWLCYGMVGTPTNVMAYIFCSALSVATFVPAMYETILLVGFMMLNNIPSDNEMDDWDDASLTEWRAIDDADGWDVTIGAREGLYFHLYQDKDLPFNDLFVGELCERHENMNHILDREHFASQKLCVDWFLEKSLEIESWIPKH